MPRKVTKRDVEANQMIQSLVGQGKKLNEIMDTLVAKGFRGIKPSKVSYYLYGQKKKSFSEPTAATATKVAKTSSYATTGAVNFRRLKSILNAEFLTDEDKTMLIRNEVAER